MQELFDHLFPKASIESLAGGDINQVFKIINDNEVSVLKVNSKSDFPEMFKKEANGLSVLSECITTPKILSKGEFKDYQYLELQFFKKSAKKDDFWYNFGRNLAKMHKKSSKTFGFEESNFIGSLVQSNQPCISWEEFLIQERLSPMIEMAVNSGEVNYLESKIMDNFYKRINELYPIEKPALLHGDLWAGNYLSSSNGPVLIDPAVYYGHREMDLGMMHLFGGFHEVLFDTYNELYPLEKDWKTRIDYNQLYPLLVHLNLFGRSYWQQVYNILQKFA